DTSVLRISGKHHIAGNCSQIRGEVDNNQPRRRNMNNSPGSDLLYDRLIHTVIPVDSGFYPVQHRSCSQFQKIDMLLSVELIHPPDRQLSSLMHHITPSNHKSPMMGPHPLFVSIGDKTLTGTIVNVVEYPIPCCQGLSRHKMIIEFV